MYTRLEFVNDMLPHLFEEKAMDIIIQDLEKFLNRFPLKSASSILDVSLDSGGHAIQLAKKGFKVTTYEPFLSAENLNLIQKEFCQNLDISWIHSLDLNIKKSAFSYITNLCYVSEFVNDFHKLEESFRKLHEALIPGGKLFMRLIGRDVLEKFFHPKFWINYDDGSFLLSDRKIDYDTGWLESNYTYIKSGVAKKYSCGTLLLYPSHLIELLKQSGFDHVSIFGGLNGEEYNEKAECLFVVAEKAKTNFFIKC